MLNNETSHCSEEMVDSGSFVEVWLGSPQSWSAACGGPWAMLWCFRPEQSWTGPKEAMSQEKNLLPQLMNKKLAENKEKLSFSGERKLRAGSNWEAYLCVFECRRQNNSTTSPTHLKLQDSYLSTEQTVGDPRPYSHPKTHSYYFPGPSTVSNRASPSFPLDVGQGVTVPQSGSKMDLQYPVSYSEMPLFFSPLFGR